MGTNLRLWHMNINSLTIPRLNLVLTVHHIYPILHSIVHGASTLHVYDYHIDNEPAGRPHRAPPPQNDRGWVHFLRMSV